VAHAVAELLREQLPERVVTVMARERRPGRVFIDWSQNDPWKSIVALYSARGLSYPTVAAPITWDEVERAATTRDLRPLLFLMDDMPGRLGAVGDLSAGLHELRQRLPCA
jgi:bifunctional non-homologous end joining protein LigD